MLNTGSVKWLACLVSIIGTLGCSSKDNTPTSPSPQGANTTSSPPGQLPAGGSLPQGPAGQNGTGLQWLGNGGPLPNDYLSLEKAKVTVFRGTSDAIGKLNGQVFHTEINNLVQNWLTPSLDILANRPILNSLFGGVVKSLIATKVNNLINGASSEQTTEMNAVAASSGVDITSINTANVVNDLSAIATAKPLLGCTTIAILPTRSATGGMLVGRNLDYGNPAGDNPGNNIGNLRTYWRPILFQRTGTAKILSIHIPGLSGMLTAINEYGVLMMTVNGGTNKNVSSSGNPETLSFRSILEVAKTAREAVALFQKTSVTFGENVVVTDQNESLVLEADSQNFALRTPDSSQIIYADNHFVKLAGSDSDLDSRWPMLQSFAAKTGPIDYSSLKAITGQVGGMDATDGNILAVFVDYKNHALIYGSDPEKAQKSALGKLYYIDLAEVFSNM